VPRTRPRLPIAAALATAVLAGLAACGDDPYPTTTSAPPPAATSPTAPPAGIDDEDLAGWTRTRAGDWATWEVRAEGSDAVTRLTWRALEVKAGMVRYAVESTTTGADGRVLASVRSEETHGAAPDAADPSRVRGAARGEDAVVAGRTVPTRVRARAAAGGDVSVWTSVVVPFSGVVRARGGGVEQDLVGFGAAK
jgi:hypothetical protein